MKNGDIVAFKNQPGPNTPGAPSSEYACTGVVVKESHAEGIMFKGSLWCDVLWSNNQVTKCFKKDLKQLFQNESGAWE